MSDMNLYVQSRGFDQDHDYRWVTKGPEAKQVRADDDLRCQVARFGVQDLARLDSPSLVFARLNGKFLLVVTALATANRTDFQGRPIRNSILWLATETEETEATLRILAATALEEDLANTVAEAVKPQDNESGFTVNFAALSVSLIAGIVDSPPNYDQPRLARKTLSSQRQLANELKHYRLPLDFSLFVVITENLAPVDIEEVESRVCEGKPTWRLASKLILSETWVEREKVAGQSLRTAKSSINYFTSSLSDKTKNFITQVKECISNKPKKNGQ